MSRNALPFSVDNSKSKAIITLRRKEQTKTPPSKKTSKYYPGVLL